MARFWNAVLSINSALLAITTVFLVYTFGMLIIEFEWREFILTLTIFVVLVGLQMVFAAMMHKV